MLASCGLLALNACKPLATTPTTTSPEPAATERVPEPEPTTEPLHVVAVREGVMELRAGTHGPVVMLEGEPVPIVDGVPKRHPSAGKGFFPELYVDDWTAPTVVFFGDVHTPLLTWLTLGNHRMGHYTSYDVRQRTADGWRTAAPSEDEPLLDAFFSSYVERDGGVLGLVQWTTNPLLDPTEVDRDAEEPSDIELAWERQWPRWMWLAGEQVQEPRVPPCCRPYAAVGAADGTLVALAHVPGPKDYEQRSVLLVWPAGSLEAERIDLPGGGNLHEPALWVNGEWAMVTAADVDDGHAPFLLMGRGTEWTRVELMKGFDGVLVGAARAFDGTLWLATNRGGPDFGPLWRRPPGGGWEPVPMPAVDPELFAQGKGWVYRPNEMEQKIGDFREVERTPMDGSYVVTGLQWHDGSIWMTADFGLAYEGWLHVSDYDLGRSVLMTTATTDDEVVTLPSAPELYLERYDEDVAEDDPSAGCSGTAMLLGPPPEAPDDRVALVGRLDALEADDGLAQIYIGQLDGTEQLVALHDPWEDGYPHPPPPTELVREVTQVLGRPPTLDCRVPRLVRMLK